MSKITLRDVAKERDWLQEAMMDPEKALSQFENQQIPGYENLPNVSIQPQSFIAVKFLSEMEQRGKDKFGKLMFWIKVEMLAPTDQGYDREAKKKTKLAKGDKASMNLGRHGSLIYAANKFVPLTGKSFAIANLGRKPTGKGNTAMDYRWKELA